MYLTPQHKEEPNHAIVIMLMDTLVTGQEVVYLTTACKLEDRILKNVGELF